MVFVYAIIGTAFFRFIILGIVFPFIPFVDFVVSDHVGPNREIFPTPRPVTPVRLLARVDMHVGFQTGGPVENFAAQGANTILLH